MKMTAVYLTPINPKEIASCRRFGIESELGHENDMPNRKLTSKLKSRNRPEKNEPTILIN